MRRLNWFSISLLLPWLLLASAWAQDATSAQPLQPTPAIGQEDSANGNAQEQQNSQATTVPDTNPPSGVQDLTLGFTEGAQNYLSGRFQFLETADTNPEGSRHGALVGTITNMIGEVDLDRTWKTNRLKLQYIGAGFIPTHQAFGNRQAHQLGISEMITSGRWSLLLADEAGYSPEGGFGFGGMGSAAGFGPGSQIFTGLNPALANQQSAFFSARRVNNTSVAQVQYGLSARSSITLYGSYGLLHFLDGGFIDSNQVFAGAGYNYSATSHDTFSLSYSYGQFHFGGVSNSGLKSHSVNLGYTRRVTGRLTFDVFAGPQLVFTRALVSVPVLQLGPFVLYRQENENFRRLSWSGRSDLKYRVRRTDLTLSYLRSITGGSGVLAGAQTSFAQASLGHPLSHWWHATAMFGYALNNALGVGSGSYDSLYGGGALHRALGRNAGLDFSYELQRETSNACATSGCVVGAVRHVFGVGFEWQPGPIRLD